MVVSRSLGGQDRLMTKRSDRGGLAQRVPQDLLDIDRWIRWKPFKKHGLKRKRPVGSLADPDLPKPYDGLKPPKNGGLGVCFTGGVENEEGARLVALDLDACRDPGTGEIAKWATRVTRLVPPTYWEVSPSGNGLRCFLWVENPPEAVAKMFPQRCDQGVEALPEGTYKTPEIQVFGATGAASYVTVTGDQIPGTPFEIATTSDLEKLLDRYDGHQEPFDVQSMPKGYGEAPDVDELTEQLEAELDAALLQGDYEALGLPSASEVWARLVQEALTLAHWHGEVVADALLETETWGQGHVDSAEPQRYANPDWVRKDVARLASKLQNRLGRLDEVFGPVDPDSIPTAAERNPERESELLVQADAFGGDEDMPMLVYDFAPEVGVIEVFGDPGSGKTPVAMSLGVHVAAGESVWFGHDVDRAGPVVYMAGEGLFGVRRRMRAETLALGHTLSELPIFITTRPGQLTVAKDVRIWIRAIRQKSPDGCALLIVDTQAQNFGPGDENATEDMNAFVQNCQRLARELRCCVMLVHHTGHAHKQRARGSSVRIGALDGSYEVERAIAKVMVWVRKAKDWRQPEEPYVGSLEVVELGTDRKGRPQTTVRFLTTPPELADVFEAYQGEELPENLQAVLGALDDLGGETIKQQDLAKLVGLKLTATREAIRELTAWDLIEKSGPMRGKAASYKVTDRGLSFIS